MFIDICTGRHSLTITVPPSLEDESIAYNDLPPELRAAKFRELAFQAKCSAANAQGEQRQTFIDSAGIWQRLANIAEQEIELRKAFEP